MGKLKLTFFLAYKSIIKGNRWAPILIVLVMSFTFANLILTPSILSGVTDTLDSQQVNTLFGNIVIDPYEDQYYLERVTQIEDRITQVPGVAGVSTHLNSSAFIEYDWREKSLPEDKGKSGTWTVIGIDPEKEVKVTSIHEHIIQGSYLNADDRDEIVLGVEISGGDGAQTSSFLTLQGVRVGENVRLTYPNGVQREYRVKGIFRAREMTADRSAYVTGEEIASVLGRQAFADRASQILVGIEQTGAESRFVEEFKALGIDGEIRSWREYGGAMSGIVSSFDMIISLINGIGLIVAAIVMFIVIYINVIHKKRQIGILRAIGIKQVVIVFSYLVQALLYAVAGIILGALLVSLVIEPYFTQYPLDLPLGLVSLGVEPEMMQKAAWGLIMAAVLAGLIPVLSIIRQSIIKAIWGN
jgi:putative ABC transport system permease protein